jgi:hypothetical protein
MFTDEADAPHMAPEALVELLDSRTPDAEPYPRDIPLDDPQVQVVAAALAQARYGTTLSVMQSVVIVKALRDAGMLTPALEGAA